MERRIGQIIERRGPVVGCDVVVANQQLFEEGLVPLPPRRGVCPRICHGTISCQAWDRWRGFANSPVGTMLRGIVRMFMVIFGRVGRMLLWHLRLAWARMSGRARIAVSIVALVLFAATTRSAAPSISATAQGLAVLLLAAVGLWMIGSSPFRRRRW